MDRLIRLCVMAAAVCTLCCACDWKDPIDEDVEGFWRLERFETNADGRMHEVDETVSEAEYAAVERALTAAGFEHYEVSNYARAGFRARHNSSYWLGAQYLGIGPGAHSFNGEVRRWSRQRPEDYIVHPRYESERLSPQDHYNEYVMTGLRCVEGIDCGHVRRQFGEARFESMMREAAKWIASGELRYANDRLSIPIERMLVSDAVIESLFET